VKTDSSMECDAVGTDCTGRAYGTGTGYWVVQWGGETAVRGTERNGLYADGGQCATTQLLYLIRREQCKTDGPVAHSV
jgi:hypothetical protein